MDVYLIVNTGQGDTEVAVVDKEIWDWLDAPPPVWVDGEGVDPHVPQSVKDRVAKEFKDDPRHDPNRYFSVDEGSYINDRALRAPSIDGYNYQYYSVADAIKAVNAASDNIVDSYEGVIY